MDRQQWPQDMPSITMVATLVALAATLGAVSTASLRGLQGGVVAGIVLAMTPFVTRRTLAYLRRPDCLPCMLARYLGKAAIAQSARLVDAMARRSRPVAVALRGLCLVVGLAVDICVTAGTAAIAAALRPIATILGIANLAALGIFAGNLAGLPMATIALYVGLPALILVLLTDQHEMRSGGRT
jgi:hypothetical protein